jgi:hypothetical protein
MRAQEFSATDEGGYLLRHPHLAGTNAGNYWVYPMGRLYALAIYSRFKNDNVLNKTTWTDFSRNILIPEDQNMSAYERIMQFLTMTPVLAGIHGHMWPQCITPIIPIR